MPTILPPASIDPKVVAAAFEIIIRGQAMGILPMDIDLCQLDQEILEEALRLVDAAGIPVPRALRDLSGWDPEKLAGELMLIADALENYPLPEVELAALQRVLPLEQIATLCGIEDTRLSLYAIRKSQEPMPEDVASRLHFLVMCVADLTGSYTNTGLSKWFNRKRAQLGNKAPADILRGSWILASPAVQDVRRLARAVTDGFAT